MENLGKKGRDKVTGFTGIIVGKIIYLFGCMQYGISPEAKDGKVLDTSWFDEGRVEIIGEGLTAKELKSESGNGPDINRDAPKG